MRINKRRLVESMILCFATLATSTSAQSPMPRLDPVGCPFERPDWAQNLKIECSSLVVPETRGKPVLLNFGDCPYLKTLDI